jgi:FemAB-related protein (PEP-CTERM system-associated)
MATELDLSTARPLVAPWEGSDAAWDATVRGLPGWTPFHLSGWTSAIRAVHGHRAVRLAATVDGEVRGVLPLVPITSPVFGRYLVSLPYGNFGGPLGDDAVIPALAEAAVREADRLRADLLELRSDRPLPIAMPTSSRRITVVLDLQPTAEAQMKAFDAKVRSQARRAEKDGVTFHFGPEQLDAFFGVFAHHMRDLGTPTQPHGLFRELTAAMPEHVWIGVARLGGVPIAGGFGFRWADTFEITWASSLRAYSKCSPNMGLYWAFIRRSLEDGARTFNFGRCAPGGGTHRFKSQWGGRDVPLPWYQHTPEGKVASTPSPNDSKYSWGPRLWQRLPVGVATVLGPRIVRYLP